MSFNENAQALGLAKFSYSKLSVGHKCPFRYQKQFVERQKPTNGVDGASANIGTLLHEVMERCLRRFNETKETVTAEAIRRVVAGAYDVVMTKTACTELEATQLMAFDDSIQLMMYRILALAEKKQSKIYVELELAIDQNFNHVPYYDKTAFFRGKIDLALVNPGGACAILDHKTGYRTLKGHENQLRVYEVLAAFALAPVVLREHNISLKTIQTGLNFVADEAFEWSSPISVETARERNRDWFIQWVNSISDETVAGVIKRGRHCNWCGYRSFCGSKVGRKAALAAADGDPAL